MYTVQQRIKHQAKTVKFNKVNMPIIV